MPWTRQQVKYLFSSGSPLTSEQKKKMEGELHANPSMGHMKKGYSKVDPKEGSVADKKEDRSKSKHHSANDGSFIDSRRGL